jgi:hypothetical protein
MKKPSQIGLVPFSKNLTLLEDECRLSATSDDRPKNAAVCFGRREKNRVMQEEFGEPPIRGDEMQVRNRLTASSVVLFALVIGAPFGQAPQGQWVPVNIDKSAMPAPLAEERAEPLRDWASISAVVSTHQGADVYRDQFYRFPPLRLDLIRPLFEHRAGQDRWIALPDGLLLALGSGIYAAAACRSRSPSDYHHSRGAALRISSRSVSIQAYEPSHER